MNHVILHMGEGKESYFKEAFAEYQKRMKAFGSLESVPLKPAKTPGGELSEDHATREFRVLMNGQYRESAKILPCCSVASAKDLTLKKDGIHFDSVSLGIFGKRYFEEYKKLR